MASLRRTRPENLRDITIQVAIVRPGPIQGGAVNPYIQRRKQRLRVDPGYRDPVRASGRWPRPLADTLGHDHLPGPGARGLDRVRRVLDRGGRGAAPGDEPQALGRGDRGLPRAVRGRCARRQHGADAETLAERVFEMVKGLSRISGSPRPTVPRSAYSPTSRRGWRVHYAPEFLCALLNEQPMGFYPPDALVHEAQRHGMEVTRARRQRVRRSSATWFWSPSPPLQCGSGSATCAAFGVRSSSSWSTPASGAGRFRSLSDLASRAGSGADLRCRCWHGQGACDALALEGTGAAVGAAAGAGAGASGAVAAGAAGADTGQVCEKERIDALFAHSGVAAGEGAGELAKNDGIDVEIGQPRAVSESRPAVASATAAVALASAARTRTRCCHPPPARRHVTGGRRGGQRCGSSG